VTLQRRAEGFSAIGVPVFMAGGKATSPASPGPAATPTRSRHASRNRGSTITDPP
jgi:hypothetical protein